ncbi:DMT family transporter [Castellaniella sp. GW247-6E4]|uniref:DMT family transporter n=1 Tax=Castellaniella sp. GW247-6E4 TaxID=3140380 RepID=UPI00331571C7
MTRSPRLLAYACLASSMFIVGSYVALSKPLAAVFPVFLLGWLRFGIGGIAMLRWLRKPGTEPRLDWHTRLLIFLEAFVGSFLFTVCMVLGVSRSSAVAAGVIMSAIPAVVALLSRVVLREEVRPATWAAVACGVVGIALLAWARPHAEVEAPNPERWLGYTLLFGAVLCEASYAVIGKRLTAVLSPKRISAMVNLWGFVLMLPPGLAIAWTFDFGAVSPPIWGLLLFYGLAASVWTVWLWMTGLRHVPASRAGMFTVMLPIGAAMTGVVLLGESFSGLQALAFGIALLGLLLASWPGRRA